MLWTVDFVSPSWAAMERTLLPALKSNPEKIGEKNLARGISSNAPVAAANAGVTSWGVGVGTSVGTVRVVLHVRAGHELG